MEKCDTSSVHGVEGGFNSDCKGSFEKGRFDIMDYI